MRVALAQINPVVGDVEGNLRRMQRCAERAQAEKSDLLVLPELCVCGYPPRDLLLRAGFVERCMEAVHALAKTCGSMTVVVGTPWRENGSRQLFNSAIVLRDGAVGARHDKRLLPGYDVFDEDRYFTPGRRTTVIELASRRVGVLICEDLWRGADADAESRYGEDPLDELRSAGCHLAVALSASPFVVGKGRRHAALMSSFARRLGCPLVMVNQVGANDDLIFDGRSMIACPGGSLQIMEAFTESFATMDLGRDGSASSFVVQGASDMHDDPDDEESEVFSALRLSIRDYVHKTGHSGVLLGLSGGIDSAVVAALGAAALGGDRVCGVMMPSRYSSSGSREDAIRSASALGMPPLLEIGIEPLHATGERLLREAQKSFGGGLAAENLQARLRGVLLMSLSNETGALVLPTSNKSELAVGYSTLYGDMCGALSVIGDLLKTRVYRLARWMNAHAFRIGFDQPPIPVSSIEKPPSAELRPDQLDTDSLPPYEVLDELIQRFVEREEAPHVIAADLAARRLLAHEEAVRLMRLCDISEFKRFQSAIIPKLTARTFGRGRPMPLVMR